MKSRAKIAEHVRAYRLRQTAAGNREVTLSLPRDAVEFVDAIKEPRECRVLACFPAARDLRSYSSSHGSMSRSSSSSSRSEQESGTQLSSHPGT